jgi:hypothetical protein
MPISRFSFPQLMLRSTILSTIAATLVAPLSFAAPLTIAQAGYLPCQPPKPKEYLLLVISRTPDVQARVRSVLPANADATVCLYRTDIVTRVGSFATVEAANAWSKYMTETLRLQAFVTKPVATAATPTNPPVVAGSGYNPQPLGAGYAVVVNYFNQPAIATEVKQLLNQEVGLVSYGQRPFLLALYTADPALANTTLQRLTDRGYTASVVDSRQLVLLRSVVQY